MHLSTKYIEFFSQLEADIILIGVESERDMTGSAHIDKSLTSCYIGSNRDCRHTHYSYTLTYIKRKLHAGDEE